MKGVSKMEISGMQTITSRQNPVVVWAVKLEDKKERERSRSFRFDGVKLFAEAIRSGVELTHILFRKSSLESVLLKTEKIVGRTLSSFDVEFGKNCRICEISDSVFDKISTEKAPEGVICIGKYIDKFHKIATINKVGSNEVQYKEEKIILAESMRDPSNLGAVIRCAVAMGIDRLILSSDCADIYNSKTVRASMGTLFSLKISIAEDMCTVIQELRESGRRVFAATLTKDAQRLGEFELFSHDCIVIGNEGHGLSDKIIDACDKRVFIPIADGAESLNAATAASIFMWELRKSSL